MFGLFKAKHKRDLDERERNTMNYWLNQNNFDAPEALYSVFRDKPRTSEDGAACIIGVCKPKAGNIHDGFVMEVRGDSVLMSMHIPPSLAGRGRELELHSRTSRFSIAEIAIKAEHKRLLEKNN